MLEQIKKSLRNILAFLAEKRYLELERLTHGVRLSAGDISRVITDYGRTVIVPPEEAFDLMDVVEIKADVPHRWSVIMPVWTKEEERSDLAIELTFIKDGNAFKIEIDDIHVL